MTIKQILVATVLGVTALVASTVLVSEADAHFIWVAKSQETGKVNIYFGEGPHADSAEFLDGIKDMRVWKLDANGKPMEVTFDRKTAGDDGWFECVSDSPLNRIDLDCEYGLFSRGGNSMFLHYSAKYVETTSDHAALKLTTGNLPLDIAMESATGNTAFHVTFRKKPAADCELQIVDQSGTTHELKTDSAGKVNFNHKLASGWLVRAKLTDATPGTHGGEDFSEKRYYCTLVTGPPIVQATEKTEVDMPKTESSIPRETAGSPFPELPVGITSFGGAVASDHLYVFGGHLGDAHDYYKDGQNAKLYRLNLKQPNRWEVVNESTGLQGLAMVEHRGKLYRVGGFAAHNEQGEEADLRSVDEFAHFDFESNQWKTLRPMPTPRSSLDAVVVGDTLFVVGGWTMRGKEKTVWCDDVVSINLVDSNAEWQTMEVPFRRRALSVGYQGDSLYVVGGMLKKGGTTSEVEIYNLANKTWSHGPKLPGEGELEGFGSSCFNIGGSLIVSTYGGGLLKLSSDGSQWHQFHQLETGRFFHRLLPVSSDSFVLVGGANMESGKFNDLPVFSVK